MTEIVEYKQSDRDKVASWRLHQLMERAIPFILQSGWPRATPTSIAPSSSCGRGATRP